MSQELALSRSTRWFWQGVALCTIALSLLAGIVAAQALNEYIVDFLRSKWALLYAGLLISVVLSVWLLVVLARGGQPRLVAWVEGLRGGSLLGKLASPLSVPLAMVLFYYVQDSVFKGRIPLAGMLWVFWLLALGCGLALKAAYGGSAAEMLALPILAQGAIVKVLSFAPDVSRYPFSLGWSEASRFYYASLPFAARLYGEHLPLSVLHPTRYLLQSLPFLVPGVPLWGLRLWQVLLWLGMTAITAGLLVWRLKPQRRLRGALLALWFFLFLFQGAVYYHLQVCIWLVLLGTSPRHPWRTLVVVLLASFWAGMSRVNWFPVPAMLAAGLYFLEAPVRLEAEARAARSAFATWLRYLLWPVIWFVAGLAVAFASQAFYILWSGNLGNASAFGSSFTSNLLWYRLWPNPTFPLGIVPGILLVSLPPLAVIAQYAVVKGRALHPLRWLALAAMLAVLIGGGLVVSVKIGGGGDLHNLDAYLTLLGFMAAYLFTDRAAPEAGVSAVFIPHYGLALFAILVPVAFSISLYMPAQKFSRPGSNEPLARLREIVEANAKGGGQVLFISQRQLLTFGYIHGVQLIPDYELLTLMEMAMSNNRTYLDRFYSDLARHRYDMIVAPRQAASAVYLEQFSDEDNVWVDQIARSLYCEYQVKTALPDLGVDVLVPRKGHPQCP